MQLKVKLLTPNAKIPGYAHSTDAGMDLSFSGIDKVYIHPGETKILSTGISVELPSNTEAQIRSRSGLAAKQQLVVLNSPGTIDEGYTGEIKIILTNLGPVTQVVEYGDRIAQMVIAPVLHPSVVVVDSLGNSDRGIKGFGSTGK